MVSPLRLRPQQTADFSLISGIGRERLQAVFQSLDDVKTTVIEASELRSRIQDSLGSKEEAASLARQLISLASYRRLYNETSQEVVESLQLGIQDSTLDQDEKKELAASTSIFEKLVGHESVILTSKALHLGYDFENIYHIGNIITDIRPVFDDDRVQIVGAVVCQTLRLHFAGDKSIKDMSVALDNDDIAALRDACNEALRKAEKAKSLISDEMNLTTFIVGEESYVDD